jgi:hypothetical protein
MIEPHSEFGKSSTSAVFRQAADLPVDSFRFQGASIHQSSSSHLIARVLSTSEDAMV